jgi:tetratricopeptide (TPR) repeat protein
VDPEDSDGDPAMRTTAPARNRPTPLQDVTSADIGFDRTVAQSGDLSVDSSSTASSSSSEVFASPATKVDNLDPRALERRGDAHKHAGRLRQAEEDYRLALRHTGEDAFRAVLHRNLADVCLDVGDLLGAEDHARAAVGLARRAQAVGDHARATWTLARVSLARGDLVTSELLLEQASIQLESVDDERFLARVKFEQARIAEARGDLAGAEGMLREAIAAHDAYKDVVFSARARIHLGVVLSWRGDLAEARLHLLEAGRLARERGDQRAAALADQHLAEVERVSSAAVG